MTRAFLFALSLVVVVALANADCVKDDKTYPEGEFEHKCLYYTCSGTTATFTRGECQNQGACVPLEQEVTNLCSVYECKNTDNVYGLVLKTPQCSIGGTCYPVGQGASCINCILNAEGNPAFDIKCQINGECVEVGSSQGCKKCTLNAKGNPEVVDNC